MKPLLLVLLAAPLAFAQGTPAPPAATLAEMKKLAFLEGDWRGGGWIQMGPARQEFTSKETVQAKLGGVAVLIEGLHHAKDDPGRLVHNALAVLSWEPRSSIYRFRAYTATGQAADAEGRLLEPGVFEWRIEPPGTGMKIRYVIRVSNGEWSETGEMTREGAEPVHFFQMNLKKIP